MKLLRALEDGRKIRAIHLDAAGLSYEVGRDGVTDIRVYREDGYLGDVPFFAVICGGKIKERVSPYAVRVEYEV